MAAIDTAMAELNAAWQAASQDIYAQQQAQQGAQPGADAGQQSQSNAGGQQGGGDRGEQSAGCGDVAAQGLVKAGIGGLVCQGYRPRGGLAGEGERMGLGG